ncbi:GAF and ANTAR domain-containing protein [Nocardioides bizhenqiangii]|uniref:GAF and ANTAR domain-containing protein n=1 Tax=Nocardioides bizhenqiangii TaxID=3095076 RepID=A0ABZ0ZNE7_9ACTN|nr:MULTISPECIES: GAF and ANTAR domain-containing protein [unclassified Nocardioides]MDZ5620965.1 GAF and ANTAR domain-containing protein [Nocardioides sp. HM23]WQQ25324.1 GAF and ANTAR domain-containing protein [Nocardioides sp. HM61]
MPYHDDELRLSELVGSLHTLLLSTDDLDTFLDGVATVAAKVVEPPASCGITIRRNGAPATAATSDPRAVQVDQIQYDTGTGPSLEALTTGKPVEVTDQRLDDRWPAYAEGAVALGVRCSLSIPLAEDGDRTLGALNVYGYDRPREFGEDERHRVEVFASQAATAIRLAVQRSAQQDVVRQLEQALVSRSVIDQAIGVLMAQEQCSTDQAFDLLRKHSQNTNRKLREVAVDVITRLTGHPPITPEPFRKPDKNGSS